MIKVIHLVIVFLFLFSFQSLVAQETGKFKKNLQIKGNNKSPKDSTSQKKSTEMNPDSSRQKQSDTWFDPQNKQHSLVEEDTNMIDDSGEPELVEVKEEVQLDDSVWVTIANYYKVWDTQNIDPYRASHQDFKDTIALRLYSGDHGWSLPLAKCYVTSPFAYRWYRWHYGTDLALDTGDSVKAAFDGKVRVVRWDGSGYGNFVVIRHYNGLETLYGHLSKQLVVPGQYVKAGDLIGWGGSTGRSSGPHLHFETLYQGDRFNPAYLYDFPGGTLKSEIFILTKEQFSYLQPRAGYSGRRSYGASPYYNTRYGVYHTIHSGDVLGSIARKYGTSVGMICRLNGISPSTILRLGRKLRVR